MHRRHELSVSLCLAALTSIACGPPEDDGSVYTSTVASAEGTNPSSTDSSEATLSGSGEGDGDPGDGDSGDPKLDVFGGSADGQENGDETGCEKVDFLFVIDNSGSMAEEQMALVNSFPGFISTISNTLMAQDYHLMVVDTDAASVGASSISINNGVVMCMPDPTCCIGVCNGIGGIVIQPLPTECNGQPCVNYPVPTGCNVEIGAGKNEDQMGNPCGIDNDLRYMLETQTNLEDTFSCAALVGSGGDGLERPMDAMVAALGVQSDPMGCNEGFLRDDAVLVVTVISDEDDLDQSMGDPAMWKQFLVDAKGGNEEAIVVLGLIADGGAVNGQCDPSDDAPTLRAFAESFVHGMTGSVCAADYAPFFDQAVMPIDEACDDFVPVG